MAILRWSDEQSNPDGTNGRLSTVCPAPPMRKRFLRLALLGLVIAQILSGQVDEYQVKAFFLYNFTRYVEWPTKKFSSPADPIVICILGQNPFGRTLEQAVRGKTVEGRPVVVHDISDIRPQCDCHVLFVGAPERRRFRSAAGVIRGAGVLTVGEADGFANDGGVINFKIEDGKLRFEINVDAAAQEQLRISSKLLSLAQIVRK